MSEEDDIEDALALLNRGSSDLTKLTTEGLAWTGPHALTHSGIDMGCQWIFRYPNNYGASVCNGYLITMGLDCEVAILRFTGPGYRDYELTNDIARCDVATANAMLEIIASLPSSSSPKFIDA